MAAITQLIPGTRPGQDFGEFRVFADNPFMDGDLNLYCDGTIYPYAVLNLSLVGSYANQAGSLNLFLYNNATPGSLNLFVQGEGGEPGAIPISGSLNLYIERPTDGSLNLYVSGEFLPTAQGQVTTLMAYGLPGSGYGDFTQNSYYGTGSMNLAIPYTHATGPGSLNLYVHGF